MVGIFIVNFLVQQVSAQSSANMSGILSPNDTTIKINTYLDNNFLCPDKKEVYLYIDLKGCSLGKRVPLNISVVFDRSGSMEGERIHHGRMALDYLIDQLDPMDNMSIVIYDHVSEVLHGSEPVKDKKYLKSKLHHIRPRGATNISAGLDKGYEEVKSTYDSTKINKVFLMSDGLANEGITDPYLLERMVQVCSTRSNVSLTTFGLGHEFDEVLMHDLAEAGGGHYYYIEKPEDAAREFGAEIKTLLSVVATNARLAIEFPANNLELARVYGQKYTTYGDLIYVDLKEVHPNETNGILLKFNVKENISAPLIFNTSLVYDNMLKVSRTLQKKTNTLVSTFNKDSCNKNSNDQVLEKIVYFTSNDLLESAITDADNNKIDAAKVKLQKGKSIITSSGQGSKSAMLDNQYKMIDNYDNHLSKWDSKSNHEIKKINKQTRHQNYKLRKLK